MLANRCDDGSAVLFYNQAFFFGGADGDLFRTAIWISLAPDVTLTRNRRDEIHPRAIGRPSRGSAPALRPDWSWRGRPRDRDELAQGPLALSIHLDHQGSLAVARGERVMCHGPPVWRKIKIAEGSGGRKR